MEEIDAQAAPRSRGMVVRCVVLVVLPLVCYGLGRLGLSLESDTDAGFVYLTLTVVILLAAALQSLGTRGGAAAFFWGTAVAAVGTLGGLLGGEATFAEALAGWYIVLMVGLTGGLLSFAALQIVQFLRKLRLS